MDKGYSGDILANVLVEKDVLTSWEVAEPSHRSRFISQLGTCSHIRDMSWIRSEQWIIGGEGDDYITTMVITDEVLRTIRRRGEGEKEKES